MNPLLFDLDGTLIDSVPDVRASLNDVLSLEGFPALDDARVKALVGNGARVMIETLLSDFGDTAEPENLDRLLTGFLETYAANPCRHSTVYPGVKTVLNTLKAEQWPMAICTNKPEATTHPVLQALGLDMYFDVIACPDHVTHRKPDGRHLHQTLAMMNQPSDNAVMIGDSENDIYAANNADIRCICVTYGYCHVPFDTLKVDAFVDSFDRIPKALASLEKRP